MLIATSAHFVLDEDFNLGFVVLSDGSKCYRGAHSQERALEIAKYFLDHQMMTIEEYKAVAGQIAMSGLERDYCLLDFLYELWFSTTLQCALDDARKKSGLIG